MTLTACYVVVLVLHEPAPRVHDEFSYILMGETFSRGHIASPGPPLPEFFDTFHELTSPVYASKYFPAQGLFIAIGLKLSGNPALGIWLSSALACAVFVWMLDAWISPGWALLGGLLIALQYGIFSYWSQSYWGGMATALGGTLFFGALRRLWADFSWRCSALGALGIVLLANTRPLEGVLAIIPGTVLYVRHLCKDQLWHKTGFWLKLVLPCFTVLAAGAFATGAYNRAITGAWYKTPYMLHEQQYQESPPLIFLSQRPQLTYSNPWLREYYEGWEMRSYLMQRIPKMWVLAVGRKIATWWDFYCGFFLGIPLILPALLRKGKARIAQIVFLGGLFCLLFFPSTSSAWRILVDLLAILELAVLWHVFQEFWPRLAIVTCTLLLIELFFAKWSFPHYFAPAACLILYLQVEGLCRIWNWRSGEVAVPVQSLSRSERRRMERESKKRQPRSFNLRWVVYALPVACFFWLVLRIEGRLNGWKDDPHGPDRGALLMNDWSLHRADIEQWLEQQSTPQLVFVRYSPRHNIHREWVFNHPDIMHSHVIWAHDLGAEHNTLLLNLLPKRTVWLLNADARNPQLVPYSEAVSSSGPAAIEQNPQRSAPQSDEQTNW